MNSRRLSTFLALAIGIAGCSTTPAPEVRYFLLRSEAPKPGVVNLSVEPVIGLGAVRVAPYLVGDGIVLEVGPGEIHEARYWRWSESLEEGLRLLVANRASSTLGRPLLGHAAGESLEYSVNVYVETFHATKDGDVKMVARWSVAAQKKDAEPSRFRFSDSLRMQGSGYPELVRTHRELAERFADEVARSLAQIVTVEN